MTSSRSNLGPLTTVFKYPDSCAVAVQECTDCATAWQGQSCGDNSFNTQGVLDNPNCWPSRDDDDAPYTYAALLGWGFYSPGLECPDGYATSCVATGSVDGGFNFQFSVLESETAIGCCPKGYHCHFNPGVDEAQTCYSIVKTGSFPTVQCSSGSSNRYSYMTVPATFIETASGSEGTSFLRAVTIYAPLFQLNRQASDLSSSSTKSTGSTSVTSHSTSLTGVTSEAPAPSSSNGGLSVGAQAGIGVGAGLVGLTLLGTALYFWRRKKKTPAVTERPKPELEGQLRHPVELYGNSSPNAATTASVPMSSQRSELP
ncbi:hypothetical protein AK830_g1329 [Neonectria ditissima]|uniref:Uncharacterized protein n=1 Tax=Neonectria ditissima TaxID=78410 RepID=A0A0N8H8Q2_9HYPO|nr:hypothetical protein AK830_g1329 [Neonectria ditissima]